MNQLSNHSCYKSLDSTVVVIYDPAQVGSIAAICRNINKAAQFLGASSGNVHAAIGNRERIKHKASGKTYAPRFKAASPKLIEMLQKHRSGIIHQTHELQKALTAT
jgi:hypothetical protein